MIDYHPLYCSFVKGDMYAFYDIMYPGLLLYTLRVLEPDLAYMAEDCVQDAIMNTYANRARFDDADHWRAYMLLCIRNKALKLNAHEGARRNYVEKSQNDDYEREITYSLIRQETLDSLYIAINELPEKLRRIFELSFEQGLKIAEIAQMLDIAEITVKKHKARLIAMLRNKIGGTPEDVLMLMIMAGYMHRM